MSETERIIAKLRIALPELRQRYAIRSLAVFGSMARGDAGPASDLDVLVEFLQPVTLSAFLALEEELCGLAGRHVDLVSRPALKPFMEQHIVSEAIPV